MPVPLPDTCICTGLKAWARSVAAFRNLLDTFLPSKFLFCLVGCFGFLGLGFIYRGHLRTWSQAVDGYEELLGLAICGFSHSSSGQFA